MGYVGIATTCQIAKNAEAKARYGSPSAQRTNLQLNAENAKQQARLFKGWIMNLDELEKAVARAAWGKNEPRRP